VDRKTQQIDETDPNRIYVENVRAFFGIPYVIARSLCEIAEREGVFVKKIGLRCPSCDRIIESYFEESDIPIEIRCETCDLMERESLFQTTKMRRIAFYVLLENL
jgi:hypothetical protein